MRSHSSEFSISNQSTSTLLYVVLSPYLNQIARPSFHKLRPKSIKFVFSKKATKFDKIFTVDLTLCKGQIKPKAGLVLRRFSQKTNEFVLFAVKSKTANGYRFYLTLSKSSGVFSMGAMGALAPAIWGQSITVTAL